MSGKCSREIGKIGNKMNPSYLVILPKDWVKAYILDNVHEDKTVDIHYGKVIIIIPPELRNDVSIQEKVKAAVQTI